MKAEAFEQCIRTVLEDGILLFADPAEPSYADAPENLKAQIRFHGKYLGKIRISCHPNIGAEVARNLLGLDDSAPCSTELAQSSVHEILNILSGTLLGDLGVEPGELSMQTPEPDDGPFPDAEVMRSDWLIDGMPLSLSLEWKPA